VLIEERWFTEGIGVEVKEKGCGKDRWIEENVQ
jgi:hypothetical protein